MKSMIILLWIVSSLLSIVLCGTITNVIHTVADGEYGGTWKKKWSWKPKWVKSWKPKTVYVSRWTRVWTPFQTSEYVPNLPLPPPNHEWVKSTIRY